MNSVAPDSTANLTPQLFKISQSATIMEDDKLVIPSHGCQCNSFQPSWIRIILLIVLLLYQGNTWTCSVSVHMPDTYPGQLVGNSSILVDHENGSAIFTNLSLSTQGLVFLQVNFISQSGLYDITNITSAIEVQPRDYVEPIKTEERDIRIEFQADYSTVVGGMEEFFTAACSNKINTLFPWPQNFTMYNFRASEGKTLTIE